MKALILTLGIIALICAGFLEAFKLENDTMAAVGIITTMIGMMMD